MRLAPMKRYATALLFCTLSLTSLAARADIIDDAIGNIQQAINDAYNRAAVAPMTTTDTMTMAGMMTGAIRGAVSRAVTVSASMTSGNASWTSAAAAG
ncbi:membrane protein [Klebsiella pneumoniae]|uniref:Membrane protein n=1 Tax=Klebsiella pneumoniae TaxID=573 RepID=A0A377ZQ61_KLEPN|nr:membrane protein [Klebsiella pneumoniae]